MWQWEKYPGLMVLEISVLPRGYSVYSIFQLSNTCWCYHSATMQVVIQANYSLIERDEA